MIGRHSKRPNRQEHEWCAASYKAISHYGGEVLRVFRTEQKLEASARARWNPATFSPELLSGDGA